MKSVLQDWVTALGLRHQGVLISAVRGCDTASKDDAAKALTRAYRGEILNAHCGKTSKAKTFIELPDAEELLRRMTAVRKSFDHYPAHYLMHLLHAAEIVGYKGPVQRRHFWRALYKEMCAALHLNPETEAELDQRLNADEDTFAARQ